MENGQPHLPTLPMHLMLTLGCWLSSPFALRCAKSALQPWNSKLKTQDQSEAFREALENEAKNRASSLLGGILRYVDDPYKRDVADPPAIWQRGNARLLDYGLTVSQPDADRPMVLFVPSLINRYYILDLEQERSMLRYLATQGLYPLVLDWGEPGEHEKNFGCDDYVTDILCAAVDFIANASQQRITLAGYCMGGVLALAAAKLMRDKVCSLALLAAPWDFHCPEFLPFVVDKQWVPMMDSLLNAQKMLPADVIQSLFYITDPWVFEQKFRRFCELQPESRAAKDFIALEHWVNDGVPMTAEVARDCMLGWAQENRLMKGKWKIRGKVIDPKSLRMPTYIAIPQNDHVVPFECAMPLAKAMKGAHITHPGAGHVGMIVGSKAKRELWQPLAEWVQQNCG